MINTRHKRVEVFRRTEGGLWLLQMYRDSEDAVEFKSVGLSVPLSELYLDARLETIEAETESQFS